MIENIFSSVFDILIKFFTNLVYIFLAPFVTFIYSVFPNLDEFVPLVYNLFNYVSKFILYIVDLSMIYPTVWAFLIGSIIYRITYSYILNTFKIVLNWWHKIVP